MIPIMQPVSGLSIKGEMSAGEDITFEGTFEGSIEGSTPPDMSKGRGYVAGKSFFDPETYPKLGAPAAVS